MDFRGSAAEPEPYYTGIPSDKSINCPALRRPPVMLAQHDKITLKSTVLKTGQEMRLSYQLANGGFQSCHLHPSTRL